MNRFYKQVLAAALACAMALPAVACTKDDNSSKNNLLDNSGISTDADGMIGFDLTLNPSPNIQPGMTTEPVVTTTVDANGDIFVNQTDINGTTVTVEGGAPATEVYTGTTLATSYAEQNYKPDTKNYQALWVDSSKKADYVFDGQFLVFDAVIAEDAPDGVYPINIFHADFANYGSKDSNPETLKVTTTVGYVCVNAAAPSVETPTDENMIISPNTVTGKPGDTVQIVFEVKNNPGFVGFNLLFNYDGNAISITDGGAGADFATRASLTAHEIK